jgi:hypothetical protein
MKRDSKKHLIIIKAGLNGETASSIAKDLGVSKTRVCQVLKLYNINTRKIRREKRNSEIKKLAQIAKKMLNDGLSVEETRNKLKQNNYIISKLVKFGVDLRVFNVKEIKKRNQKCLNLYKKGLTAYEIIDLVDDVETTDQVYKNVCTVNNHRLPKRISTRVKKSIKLDKEIIKLKKKYTFNDLTKILNDNGFTNLNNDRLKVETVRQRYYKYQKKNT